MPLNLTRSWTTPDLDLWRDTCARFVEQELVADDEAARKRGNVGHAVWRKAGELGLLCTDIPEEYGGGGGDFRHEAVLSEECARRGISGWANSVHSIVAHYFLNHGTAAQKQRYLPRLARGELVGAIAMTEPGCGSDLQGIRARAERRGDEYLLNGSKTFITNGLLAGVVLVVCKTDPTLRARGTSIVIVETGRQATGRAVASLSPAGGGAALWDAAGGAIATPGYRVGRVLDKMGMKSQDTAELFFDDVSVPADNLLGGKEGQGFFQLMGDLPYERLFIGVAALGCMEGAFEATLKYVRERKAFGQTVAEFQNTRFKLAEVATQIQVGRAFIDHCVELILQGKLDTATASMAKLWAAETQGRVLDELLQLHGGYGFMNEYLIARMYADARVQRIYGGTSEIMKEVISRSL
jgi:acyl-CoA dehydrogenase